MPLPEIFPIPRTITVSTDAGPGAAAPVTAVLDETLPAQGYRITIDAAGITLTHADPSGLRYAQQTLDQLRTDRSFGDTALVIEDWPDFAVRGFMLDISRDRVPTRRTFLRYIDIMSLARINHLELYTEHTFAFEGHDEVWQDASPLSPADLLWMDDQCAARGISLVPNQNTLGHMERWVKHPAYRERAINPDGFDMFGEHRAASTVVPSAENADFVGELLDDVSRYFRADSINIGADEPWELIIDQSGGSDLPSNGQVYFDYVTRVMRRFSDRGYNVEFWADVFGEHPELMDQLPEGTVPVVWQYDSASLTTAVVAQATAAQRQRWASVGLDIDELQTGFAGRARVLTAAGLAFWVAPGTSTWQSFTGRLDNAIENMTDAARFGSANGATGYLNTAWGDHGMYDPPAVSFGPLAFGGAVSWNVEGNESLDIAAVLNAHVVLDPTGITGEVLTSIGRAVTALDAPLLNASQLFTVLHRGGVLADGAWPSRAGVEAADGILAAAEQELTFADPACLDGDVVLRETRQAIAFARFGAHILRLGEGAVSSLPAADARRLLVRLEDLLEEHRRTWLLRSRPGGLVDSVSRLDPMRRALVSRAATARD
ncbi:MAG: glycoside hydrolase family 20 [Microbacteriaceae bacterium]|nr:glycoside hydrolase family 20 [Microbacteriaceae bacterium]